MFTIHEEAKASGCADCGEMDPIVLEFHHRDPAEKKFNVASARGKSVPQLVSEIEKCDVVCANCHRRREWQNKHGDVSSVGGSSGS